MEFQSVAFAPSNNSFIVRSIHQSVFGVSLRSLIQSSKTLSVKLTRTHEKIKIKFRCF